jgi:hypothetical protein
MTKAERKSPPLSKNVSFVRRIKFFPSKIFWGRGNGGVFGQGISFRAVTKVTGSNVTVVEL